MDQIELAWAAGFLEGEGCFGWYGTSKKDKNWNLKGYPVVAVCSVDKDTIEHFGKIFNGVIRESKITTTGKQVWEFRAINEDAVDIMVNLFPLMGNRRQEKIKEVMALYAERSAALIKDYFNNQTCPQGHQNFGYRKDNGNRYCKTCQRDRMRAKREAMTYGA